MVNASRSPRGLIWALFCLLSGGGNLFGQRAPRFTAGDWPSFRGPSASGVADKQNLPESWDATTGKHLRWKTAIPGLAHASPIVWRDRVFVTTAVSSRATASFRPGLYGDGDASGDRSVHQWKVYCLDKKTGKILWEKTAIRSEPIEKRHIKATYADSTPVTNGRYVIAFFGSQGVYAFDMEGEFLWSRDLGHLDLGAYRDPSYEWGTASSPIIFEDLVILQCDTQGDSFVTGLDIQTGETVWKAERDELPSWGTPTVYRQFDSRHPGSLRFEKQIDDGLVPSPRTESDPQRPILITNGSNFIRGYDPRNGFELWRLGGSSKITAPTPVFDNDIIVVASGRSPERPIFAIRPGAVGNISLQGDQTSNEFIAWSKTQRGPYMPTPIVYRGYLYVLANQGIFDCYKLDTGEEIYRERIPHQGSGFSASPVASDNRIYLASEDGDIFVVAAGTKFRLISRNPMGELLMATPALSDGMLLVRGPHHLFAIGR